MHYIILRMYQIQAVHHTCSFVMKVSIGYETKFFHGRKLKKFIFSLCKNCSLMVKYHNLFAHRMRLREKTYFYLINTCKAQFQFFQRYFCYPMKILQTTQKRPLYMSRKLIKNIFLISNKLEIYICCSLNEIWKCKPLRYLQITFIHDRVKLQIPDDYGKYRR